MYRKNKINDINMEKKLPNEDPPLEKMKKHRKLKRNR